MTTQRPDLAFRNECLSKVDVEDIHTNYQFCAQGFSKTQSCRKHKFVSRDPIIPVSNMIRNFLEKQKKNFITE